MTYIFMDESGDLGFDFEKSNTSRYFVMSFVIVENDDRAKLKPEAERFV